MIYKNVNGTQKLVTNIRKPKKWRRFEYLQSSGTLYIDTGINPRVKPRVVAVLAMLNNADRDYWGNKAINGSAYYANFASYKLYYYRYGSTTSQYINYAVTLNTIHEWDVSDKVYVDGDLKFTSTNTYTYNASQSTIQIFKAARSSYYSTYRLYSFKLYDGDTLVRDYVPALFNGEYGLWDLIQNRFYENKGTGTFTVGPEVGKPYEEIEKLIIPSTLLPSGVELYDYIESTGTQWIDTGVYGYMNHSYELDFLQTAVGNYRTWGVFGLSSYIGYNMSFTYGGGWIIRWSSTSSGQSYVLMNTIDTNRHTLKILNGVVYFDGTNKGTSAGHNTSYSINYNLYLFTINPANTTPTTNNKVKIFSYKDIDANGVLVRNMLPCTYFGEPGMWDTVTKQFYRNQGTGRFTLGNKIELVLYDYLQGTGTLWINTEWLLTLNFKFNYKVNMQSNGSNPMIWGSYVAGNRYTCQWPCSNTIWNQRRNSGLTLVSAILNLDCVVEDTLNTSTINGVLNSSNSMTFLNNGVPLGIFNSPGTSYIAKGKLYYFQIRDGNNLVKDFVPCTYNGTPGLWDKVELKFYENVGSGTFTLGRLLSGEIPVWVLKNALVGDGNAYINTGLKLDTTKKIRIVTEVTAHPNDGNPVAFFGTNDYLTGIMGIYHYTNNSEYYLYVHGQSHTGNRPFNINAGELILFDTTIDFPNLSTIGTFQGTQINGTFTLITDTTHPITVFKSQYATKYKGKCYKFQIYLDDVLIRNYVPATMGGRPGLYDKVNHKMYFNANSSGNFTVE